MRRIGRLRGGLLPLPLLSFLLRLWRLRRPLVSFGVPAAHGTHQRRSCGPQRATVLSAGYAVPPILLENAKTPRSS